MRARNRYLLAGLSGVLLLLSLPPFRFGGVLVWFAFDPLLLAIYYQAVLKRRDRLVSVATVGGFLLLDARPFNELRIKYGEIYEAVGFTYSSENKPSVVFKGKEWTC